MGWSMVNFSASKMHLPHHRRTNKFPWSPVAAYWALPVWSNDCRSLNPSAKASLFKNYITIVRVPTPPTWTNILNCIVLLASPLSNAMPEYISFNTHIFSSPLHLTDVLIMCWPQRDFPEGSGKPSQAFSLASRPQRKSHSKIWGVSWRSTV